MNYENIVLEKKNAIAYVTVNRPKVLNALNMATMEELRAAFHDIKNDAEIRVAILTGSGETGCGVGEAVCASRAERAQPDRESREAGDCVYQRIRPGWRM
jgi:enoyl-CoA hydratase